MGAGAARQGISVTTSDLGEYQDRAQLDRDVADLLWDHVAYTLTGRGVEHETAVEAIRRVANTDDWH